MVFWNLDSIVKRIKALESGSGGSTNPNGIETSGVTIKNNGVGLLKFTRSDNTNLLQIGKKDANSNQVYIASVLDHMVIQTPQGKALRFDIPGGIQATNPLTLGTEIKIGYGASTIHLTAEDGTTKTIALGSFSGRGRIDLDLENNAKIKNVPTPTVNSDVVNKQYVDEKVAGSSGGVTVCEWVSKNAVNIGAGATTAWDGIPINELPAEVQNKKLIAVKVLGYNENSQVRPGTFNLDPTVMSAICYQEPQNRYSIGLIGNYTTAHHIWFKYELIFANSYVSVS